MQLTSLAPAACAASSIGSVNRSKTTWTDVARDDPVPKAGHLEDPHQPSLTHDPHTISQTKGLLEDVRGKQYGDALALELVDPLAKLLDTGWIEVQGGLIEQQQRHISKIGDSQRETLKHASGVAPDLPVGLFIQGYEVQGALDLQWIHALQSGIEAENLPPGQESRKINPLGQIGHLLLRLHRRFRQVDSIHQDMTRRRSTQPDDGAKDGRLATAIGAKQHERFADLHLEIEILDGVNLAVPLLELLETDHR